MPPKRGKGDKEPQRETAQRGKAGRGAGARRHEYSFVKIVTGSDLSRRRMATMRASSGRAGPVVWLTGCAHGDEVGGIVVIQEVFKRLRKSGLQWGELHAFPLMNPMGFELAARHVAVGGEDLNRCFPGNPQGSLAQRIAHTIFSRISETRPALVLDLHNDWRSSIPYAVLDPAPGSSRRPTYSQVRRFARQTGLLLVVEPRDAPDAPFSAKTLSGSLLLQGTPALTLELGEAHVVNERNVSIGVRAVWNVLTELGMVARDGEPYRYEVPREFRDRFLLYSEQPLSSSSGIIRLLVKPGDVVRPGQPLADIYNAFGKRLEKLLTQRDGIVIGHCDSCVAFPGVPVVAFGLLDSAQAGVRTR